MTRHARTEWAAAAGWLAQAGLRLGRDEAQLFLAAAQVLLSPAVDLRAAVLRGEPPTPAEREAVQALWRLSGAPPLAPTAMPLQPMAPGLVGQLWRRLLGEPGSASGAEAE